MTLRVGLIGFGGGRIFHAPFIDITKGLELYKIYTRSSGHIAKELYPQAQVVDHTEAIFKDKDVDLIVVQSPNALHYEHAKEALMNDKHVIVDKPLSITTEQADELLKLARDKDLFITTYQNRRLDSDFRTVKKIIESEKLGELVEYEAHFDRFRNFKREGWKETNIPGSGLLYDLGAHLIDQALSLFGMPHEVYGDLRIQREEGAVIDAFEVHLLYKSGLKVTLKAGMLVKVNLPHFVLLGQNGSFVKYGMDIQEDCLKQGIKPRSIAQWGEEPKDLWGELSTVDEHSIIESEKGDYTLFYENVYDVILHEEEPIIKPEDGRNVIALIEKIIESHKRGKRIKL